MPGMNVSCTPFSLKSICFISSLCKEINVVKTAFNIFAIELDKGFSLTQFQFLPKNFLKFLPI